MQEIQNIIQSVLHTLYGIESSPEITLAPKPELGEYCVNIFPIVKSVGKAPNLISEEVAIELAKHTEIFTSTSATGGYVNFFLTDGVWIELFSSVIAKHEAIQEKTDQDFSATALAFARNDKPTIIVDYIGANAGKPLHIAHICTPSIGQAICNVYRHLGYRVIGDSHFGDWGGIFGKLIWMYKYEFWQFIKDFWGDINVAREYQESECLTKQWVNYLLSLYQKVTNLIWRRSLWSEEIIKYSEEIEAWCRLEFQYLSWVGIDLSDPEEFKHHEENIELWKKFTSISVTETEKKLDILNVHATYNIGESFYEWLGLPRPNGENYPDLEYTMKDIVAELVKKWIATQNEDGSVGVVFPEESKLPSCILQKKDGTGLYLTSDLAAIKYRLTNGWNPSKIIYSVDVRQQLHLKQAFTIAKMAWPELTEWVEIFHAFNGFIKLKEGAMSTRHGTVIFLEALIDEGNERTGKILEEKWRIGDKALNPTDIQAITIWAIKYSYLAQDREKDVTFDWNKALSFEWNSGPYIQYAYVRGRKISEAGNIRHPEWSDVSRKWEGQIDSSQAQNDEILRLSAHDKSLIQILSRFDEIVDIVAKTYKPHHLALYSYDVAVIFNSFYVHTPKILEERDENLKQFRLALIENTTKILEKSFELLGIQMPSEM